MHSSIQFRHEATSAYGLRRLRVSDCSEETHFLQTVICAGDFSLWGEICEWKLVTGSWTLGSSSVLGLDRVSLVVLLRMVRLLQLVSQTVTLSPVCHREARSPTRNGTEMIWITLIWREKKQQTDQRWTATNILHVLSSRLWQCYHCKVLLPLLQIFIENPPRWIEN